MRNKISFIRITKLFVGVLAGILIGFVVGQFLAVLPWWFFGGDTMSLRVQKITNVIVNPASFILFVLISGAIGYYVVDKYLNMKTKKTDTDSHL